MGQSSGIVEQILNTPIVGALIVFFAIMIGLPLLFLLLVRKTSWFRRHHEAITAWSYLTPMVVYYAIMTFVPLLFLIYISFTRWNLISPPEFIGLENIKKVFSGFDNYFYPKAIIRTFFYAIGILSLNIVGGFLVALVLNQNLKGKGVFRTTWFLPAVFSGAVMALLIARYLAASNQGIVNMLIGKLGFEPVNWINHPFWSPVIAVVYPVWMGIGFTVILFLAGLQGVDENLYDAARVDGANNLQLLRYITIPQMVPVLLFITVTGLVGSMQMWEVPRLITSGNPNFATYTLGYSIMQDSFGALDMGMGTAESLVLFVMLLVFIGWQLNQYRKQYKI
jgi:ABC-type sugar transport system permease subunit